MRPDKDTYYLNIAAAVSERSTCLRRQYGAIIVKDDEIIGTGYNGSPRGDDNCCDLGVCWREFNRIPHGEQYEKCRAVHAEENALLSAARRDCIGATLYLTGYENGVRLAYPMPCEICSKLLRNAGIVRVVNHSEEANQHEKKQ